jgi:signal transduction histidine kinase
VQYAAYRIVQEALSNVIRHAAGADTTVRIASAPAGMIIDVINECPPSRVGPSNPSGHGLTGIRERAEATGGTAWVGPTDRGGFWVQATLPAVTGPESGASLREDLAGSVPAPPSTERGQVRQAHSP